MNLKKRIEMANRVKKQVVRDNRINSRKKSTNSRDTVEFYLSIKQNETRFEHHKR